MVWCSPLALGSNHVNPGFVWLFSLLCPAGPRRTVAGRQGRRAASWTLQLQAHDISSSSSSSPTRRPCGFPKSPSGKARTSSPSFDRGAGQERRLAWRSTYPFSPYAAWSVKRTKKKMEKKRIDACVVLRWRVSTARSSRIDQGRFDQIRSRSQKASEQQRL